MTDTSDNTNQTVANDFAPPAISLPKGGGAIRGIGEKFAANPVTGTGSMTVPIATSPGRSGFGPQLALSYDSGAGNGPFGFGWSLSLPIITRKTDKGLPLYQDTEESDTFILSGSEDLVPVLVEEGGEWRRKPFVQSVDGVDYQVQRYRPRVEGLFARIERWVNQQSLETHWRSITRDNVSTLYGKTAESRIADPADSGRVFSWLICESYDDKGNAIRFEYAGEDSAGVEAKLHERNRTDETRSADRYLKRIKYGNLPSRLVEPDLSKMRWMFEVVFDYGEGHYELLPVDQEGRQFVRARKEKTREWPVRQDPFSSYRAGFEVRTYRLCQRALMFHHFPEELGTDDYLVRATEFKYAESPLASFINEVTQSGYVRRPDGTYLKKSLPPVEFEYSQAVIDDRIQEIDAESLENLPYGLDDTRYRWVDLDGEGVPGILTEQGNTWFYKANLGGGRFGPQQVVTTKPSLAALNTGPQQLIDLAGDGQLDLVQLSRPTPGFYERTQDQDWEPFTPFASLPNIPFNDPNLRFVDLTGDGHADVLITEHEAVTWYPSLAEEGFGRAEKVRQALDEETGPRVVFADSTQSIFLADMSGDGLSDLVRIRNGEVCYWPSLGYGRFGAKVTMDDAPRFDLPDLFDQRRLHLADIDGSGVSDIVYLASEGIQLYFNQSGNGWSRARSLPQFPRTDHLSMVTVVDLLGNGTACVVWSSPLPGYTQRPMRFIDLMGGQKPHLMIGMKNNLGAETRLHYASSTKFYLADKINQRPWVTRLPFPVHVVERVETLDRISHNRFVTRYAYHHGYFDGVEREFRGFGMIEQQDTEEFAALSASDTLSDATNIDEASHVPPVLTKTWFHTGFWAEGQRVSRQFEQEYYREPGLNDAEFAAQLLPDTILPSHLSARQQREAHRALKGSILRQETYALDDTPQSFHPYVVSERNYTIKLLQPHADNRFAVFFTHQRESIVYNYERDPADPRISHELTLEVDSFGNVLRSAAVGYGRRRADVSLTTLDQARQAETLITCAENRFTGAVELDNDYHAPLPCESGTFELTGLTSEAGRRFDFSAVHAAVMNAAEIAYETKPSGGLQKRLIEHTRTLYRRNDLDGPLPLGQLESLALLFESYRQAFTPGLLRQAYQDRVTDEMLANEGHYVHTGGDENWWRPSGRIFFSQIAADTSAEELDVARQHFFRPRRFLDPFRSVTIVSYDVLDLLPTETRDALGNIVRSENDYRVVQPRLITDPNGNRTTSAFDALGLVVGTAVMGKEGESLGDSLDGFEPNLDEATVIAHLQEPLASPNDILNRASTRMVYDLHLYQRTSATDNPQPNVAYTLVRETHDADLPQGERIIVQRSFSYSDGFGREIQKKIQAEPGPARNLDANGNTIVGADNQPEMTKQDVSPRWVGSGWTVFNNKGKPVRQYEPFFTGTHRFEFDIRIGVSPVLFYDPIERVVATLHPNHTWEKVVFDPWRQETWDVNDTVLIADPKADADVGDFFSRLQDADYLPTWYARRQGGALGLQEEEAASKARIHSNTPTVAHFDCLRRTFLTIAHNKFKRTNSLSVDHMAEEFYGTRVILDIEGEQLEIIDAKSRVLMRYDYNLLGNRIHQASMEAGERWTLNDVAGKAVYAWDSRNNQFRTTYDPLRRPTGVYLREGAGPELLVERTVYGESQPDPESSNLRGKVVEHYDQAGVIASDEYDFKANLLHSYRRLAQEYKTTLDWSASVALEATTYVSRTRYDALNRPTEQTAPDHSVIRSSYNEANLLERVDVNLRAEQANGQPVWTSFITDIDYDARGQRTLIDYGNGVRTTYEYDPFTFRLVRLLSKRNARDFSADCPSPAPTGWPGCHVQNLHYTYDPAGNITHIRDKAQQTIYFRNRCVEASAEYTYDAIYRLIEATGREHLGQIGGAPIPHSHNDAPRVGIDWSANDGQALGTYIERYVYDAVGNFQEMQHRGSDPVHPGWTRNYAYNETSLIEDGASGVPLKTSNRLSSTTVGSTNTAVETYVYDAHGNMTRMPHLGGAHPTPNMHWDYRDQLRQTGFGVGGTTYYVYDAAGQRVRKVCEKSANLIEERIYLGGFEIFRRRQGAARLERETLHILDDKRRIALVEMRTLDTAGNDHAPPQLIRYQFSNHLGSASLELDQQAQIISYEEYTPYGSTSYQAVRNLTETPKRYRYTGKERDEESGFYYHGARYYAPWLGRWTSADPAGLVDGVNSYWYVKCRPLRLADPSGLQSGPTEDLVDPTIVRPGKYTGKESQEQIRTEYAQSGIHYTGEARWDSERGTWWVDRSQLAKSEVITFEDDVITAAPTSGQTTEPTTSDEVQAEEEPGLLDQAGEYIRESSTAQFTLGLFTGGLAGATPGGFVAGIGAEASGVSKDLPSAFRMGYGLGEAAWGVAQIIGGIGGEVAGGTLVVGGAGASATGVGALVGVPAIAGGGGVIAISTAAIAEGAADIGVGIGVFMSAMGDDGGRAEKGKGFRGGGKSTRDKWYGYDKHKGFVKWWHRQGKKEFDYKDIDNAQDAKEAFEYWVQIGKPVPK